MNYLLICYCFQCSPVYCRQPFFFFKSGITFLSPQNLFFPNIYCNVQLLALNFSSHFTSETYFTSSSLRSIILGYKILIICFFQCFKDIAPLFSPFHCFWREICCNLHIFFFCMEHHLSFWIFLIHFFYHWFLAIWL